MKLVRSKLIMAFMILVLIGTVVTGNAGAAVIQSKQLSKADHDALTSVSIFAGNGDFADWDGAASEASFRMPQGMAVLEDGSVLVADSRNHLIRQVKEGQVSTYAGVMLDEDASGTPSGGWSDGVKQTAVFNNPSGMDTDSEGNLYIADTDNHLIRKISKDGTVTTIAGDGLLGHKDGKGKAARFYQPHDVAVAADGTLYVADTLNHLIRKITPDGNVTTLNAPSERVIEVIGGYAVHAGDYADGSLLEAKFNEPTSIAIDNKGNLYISDTGNNTIRYIDLAEGTVTTAAGLSQGELPKYVKGALYAEGDYVDGASTEARFYSPRGIAVTEEQGLLIADSLNHTIRYLMNGQVTTIAGVPAQFGHIDGINGHNLLHHPTDVATLPNGNMLIADSYNNKIRELEFYKLPDKLPQNDQLKVVFENQNINFDAQPEIVKGNMMIPVKELTEVMGYEVGFHNKKRTIELTKADVKFKLQVGSHTIAIKNVATNAESQKKMDAAPYIKAGEIYAPVQFFTEVLGVDIKWEQSTSTVILREIVEAVDKLPKADRNLRTATLEQIKGTVWIKQSGGSMTFRAYDGISLHEGDHIRTENNSSATLKTVDRKDEITISENSELYISNLSNASQVKHTSFVQWSGLVGASVTSLVDSKDTFRLITPTSVNDVRGTNFAVGVDPATGLPILAVLSGIVQAGGNGTGQSSGNFVYPAQQLNLNPGSGTNELINVSPLDIADFVESASPEIIQALLMNIQKINQENAEMLEKLQNGTFETNSGSNLQNLSQVDFEQYQNNIENLIANLLKQAHDQQKIKTNELQEMIDAFNKSLDKKIDLINVPPLQLTEQQKQLQDKNKQLEEELKKKKEEQKKQREQQLQQADNFAEILEDKKRLEQENKKRQEEVKKRAADLLKQKLLNEERQRFEQQQQELERQKQQQEAAQQQVSTAPPTPESGGTLEPESIPGSELTPEPGPEPTPTPTPEPTPEPDPEPINSAPSVINHISDWMVNTEHPFEINVSDIFFDVDGDTLIYTAKSSDSNIAKVEIEGDILVVTPYGMGSTEITISAHDGNGGTAETAFRFGLYPIIADLRAGKEIDHVQLYWEHYEEGVSYHIYIDGELFESTIENTIMLPQLLQNKEYSLRVVAVNDEEEIIAYADLGINTNFIEQ